MALTADVNLYRRGPLAQPVFGYPVAPGETVFKGSLVGLNSSGQIVRAQTSGCILILGFSDRNLSNVGSGSASATMVEPQKGCFGGLTVTGSGASHIGGTVYAVDDATVNVVNTGGTLLAAGVLAGIDNGTPYVTVSGSF